MKKSRRMAGSVGVLAAVAVAASGLIVTSVSSAAPQQAGFLAGVVCDVGRFNDKGFNQLSLQGCKSGAKRAGGTCRALESRSTADYIPNFTKLVRAGANITVATGFLLADGDGDDREEVPEVALRDRGLLGACSSVREQGRQAAVQECPRAHLRDEREQLHDRLPRRS